MLLVSSYVIIIVYCVLLLFVVGFSVIGSQSQIGFMNPEEILFTFAYILVSACIVCPPTEFINAGLTVQNVLAPLLGSEQMDFVHYHIRRTTSSMLIHAVLPIGELKWNFHQT